MDVHSYMIVYSILLFAFFKVAVSIVGGKDVTEKNHKPWMVSIQKDERHVCGGILIKDQWVLTAANCKEQPQKSVTVLIGALSLKKFKDSQRVGILDFKYPTTYNEQTNQDDIMLIKLNKKVKVEPIQIPKGEKDIPTGKRCVVMGWGTTDSKVMKASDKLQMLEVTVMNRKRCNLFYSEYFEITRDMLCAGSMEKNRGTCWGDTGGPLLHKKIVVGVVSRSKGCGDPRKPTVYTFLSKRHISWINSILKKQFNSTPF
ncbi:granzyme K-like [Triplophysa rosa]|uniref:granzyme K-like n=1 Tax=Triplophysa rosa TaxID=992332 RepID=UPI0025461880|nr:granzyme K-like [Triplophysa rosa]